MIDSITNLSLFSSKFNSPKYRYRSMTKEINHKERRVYVYQVLLNYTLSFYLDPIYFRDHSIFWLMALDTLTFSNSLW